VFEEDFGFSPLGETGEGFEFASKYCIHIKNALMIESVLHLLLTLKT